MNIITADAEEEFLKTKAISKNHRLMSNIKVFQLDRSRQVDDPMTCGATSGHDPVKLSWSCFTDFFSTHCPVTTVRH